MGRTPVRVRGMNAADTTSVSGNGHTPGRQQFAQEKFPHASLRQLVVAIAILVIGAFIARFTFIQLTGQTSYSGTVEPQQLASLDFTQTGRIAQVLVKPGDRVVTGQPLATQDQEDAKVALANAQAVLSAMKAKLAALQSPTLSDSAKKNYDLQVQSANSQLAAAKKALADANTLANAEVAQAQQALAGATATRDKDSAQFKDTCPDGGDPDSASERCVKLQAQVQKDIEAVNNAAADLSRTKTTTAQRQEAAASAVSSASGALALKQSQQATAAAPASAADLSSAQADVASAQTAVDQDTNALKALTLVSPFDGTVANVGGIVGELDGTTGVHAFSGPQSLQSGSGSGFSLFPPASGTGPTQNSTGANQQPLISLVTAHHNAIVQVGESLLPSLHPGRAARVTVNALHARVNATVQQVIPIPVDQGGSVEYKVRLTVPTWPDGTEPGMSLSVVFP